MNWQHLDLEKILERYPDLTAGDLVKAGNIFGVRFRLKFEPLPLRDPFLDELWKRAANRERGIAA